jgi:hypothetical protein
MTQQRVHIRVLKDGAKTNFELVVDGLKIAELNYIDILEAAMQFVSSLRWGERQ